MKASSSAAISRAAVFAALLLAAGAGIAASQPDSRQFPTERESYSRHLGGNLTLLPGVFPISHAEMNVLPYMEAHPELFRGKRVLDIGTGSGIVALYAAKLGADRVVATDIDEAAIVSTRRNAARFGFGKAVEARLVSKEDCSAYAPLKAGETFDIIISNPPNVLDLDTPADTMSMDSGGLGISILRGLDERLAPGGSAVLFYGSLFYHQLMVKLARHIGLRVRHQNPNGLRPWEVEVLFNSYLRRVIEKEKLPPGDFDFRWKKDFDGRFLFWDRGGIASAERAGGPGFPGFIIVEKEGSSR